MASIKKGFTLVELLLVITIIGILTTIIIASLTQSRKKGHDSQRMSDLNTVASALANYYAENHVYPSPLSTPAVSNYSELLTVLRPNYLSSMPTDPTNSGDYVYHYSGSSGSYTLGACLETVAGKTGNPLSLSCSVATYQLVNGEPTP